MKIKVVNLNTWYGGKKTWGAIVEYLKSEQPDIVLLQEAYASDDPSLPQYMRTVESLKNILNFPYSEYTTQFTLQTDMECAPMGNAILSKFPLSNKNVVWLQGTQPILADHKKRETIPEFPRNILHCEVSIEGKTYNLMTLQGVWSVDEIETDRQKEMGRKIAGYIQDKNNIIIAGDFNVNENTETLTLLEKNLVNIFKGERTSSFNMKQKVAPGFASAIVDFILTSPNIKVVDHYTPDVNVSDHQSQVAILDL